MELYKYFAGTAPLLFLGINGLIHELVLAESPSENKILLSVGLLVLGVALTLIGMTRAITDAIMASKQVPKERHLV